MTPPVRRWADVTAVALSPRRRQTPRRRADRHVRHGSALHDRGRSGGLVRRGRTRRRGRVRRSGAQTPHRRGGRVTMGTVATGGTFDGIHRGHQAVLAAVARRGRTRGLASLLVTFDPHPLEVVNPSAAPRLLTLPEEKLGLVRAVGVERLEVVPFTPELARLGPQEFVRAVLRARLGVEALVLGDGYGVWRGPAGGIRFGR